MHVSSSHQRHLNFKGQRVVLHKTLPDNILHPRVLYEPKAPGTDPLHWPMERQDLGLGHDCVALALVQAPRMNQLDLDAPLKRPVQVVVVLALHHVDVKAQEARRLENKIKVLAFVFYNFSTPPPPPPLTLEDTLSRAQNL